MGKRILYLSIVLSEDALVFVFIELSLHALQTR